MLHEFMLEGHAFRLRPIGDQDAAFVLALRGNPELNQYLHASSNRIEDQLAWFASYYQREGDYYFVLERRDNGAAEGVISIYDVDPATLSAEWGRWILRPGSLAAIESAWLIYRVAFELLGLHSLYCRTLADNSKVVSFHDSCGISSRRVLRGHVELGGVSMDAVEHRVEKGEWADLEPRLNKLAQLAARRVLRG